METVLHNVWVFVSAALAMVPLAKRLRLGAVFGYLLAALLSLVAAARGALGRLLQTGAQGTPARPAARDVTASP